VAELIASVAEQMARDGFRVVHRPDALVGGHERYNDLRSYDPLLAVRELVGESHDGLGEEVAAALGTSVGPHRYSEAVTRERAATWRREFLEKLAGSPVLIAPVAPCAAVTHDGSACVGRVQLRNWELMAFCRAISLAGVPAIVVPCGRSREGLPLAVQVIAPPLREDLALDVAAYLEAAFGGFVRPPAF
jgi:amidase